VGRSERRKSAFTGEEAAGRDFVVSQSDVSQPKTNVTAPDGEMYAVGGYVSNFWNIQDPRQVIDDPDIFRVDIADMHCQSELESYGINTDFFNYRGPLGEKIMASQIKAFCDSVPDSFIENDFLNAIYAKDEILRKSAQLGLTTAKWKNMLEETGFTKYLSDMEAKTAQIFSAHTATNMRPTFGGLNNISLQPPGKGDVETTQLITNPKGSVTRLPQRVMLYERGGAIRVMNLEHRDAQKSLKDRVSVEHTIYPYGESGVGCSCGDFQHRRKRFAGSDRAKDDGKCKHIIALEEEIVKNGIRGIGGPLRGQHKRRRAHQLIRDASGRMLVNAGMAIQTKHGDYLPTKTGKAGQGIYIAGSNYHYRNEILNQIPLNTQGHLVPEDNRHDKYAVAVYVNTPSAKKVCEAKARSLRGDERKMFLRGLNVKNIDEIAQKPLRIGYLPKDHAKAIRKDEGLADYSVKVGLRKNGLQKGGDLAIGRKAYKKRSISSEGTRN
jgi:hypothetical protein